MSRIDFTKKAYRYARRSIESIFETRSAKPLPEAEENKHANIIISSGFFDVDYYLRKNPDVKRSGVDPLMHFINYGGVEGRNPGPRFDSRYYLTKHAEVRESRANPLVHYLTSSGKEPRSLKPHKPKAFVVNKNATKRIDIINVNFFDWSGEILYKGGAERYVFDLAVILKGEGHHARILQNALVPFKKVYRGIEVVGIVTGAADSQGASLRKMSKAFDVACREADLVIASPIDLACEITSAPVIGINHGIHWDSITRHLYSNRTSDYDEIFDALQIIKTGVCVDTNFINWTRTYDYSLGEKLRYVPNYYDCNEFISTEKDFDGRLKIMYPRRLYDARGIFITLEAFDHLLGKYPDIDLLLVGQTTDPTVIKAVKQLMKKFPKQVTLEEYDMEDMHKAYKKSNVVLIPTRYSEGTSLSCLEAMATNNALIATNIGGLPNLVIDQYNGLLIDPSTKALIQAVDQIVNDRKFTKQLAINGLEMVKVFEKKNWDKRWIKILEEEL